MPKTNGVPLLRRVGCSTLRLRSFLRRFRLRSTSFGTLGFHSLTQKNLSLKKRFQNIFDVIVSSGIGIIYMNQIKSVILANLFFLFIPGNYFWIVVVLRSVKFYCKKGFFFSTETFFINHEIQASLIEKFAISFIFVEEMGKLNFSFHEKF